jgi:hypothetical protein
VRLLLLIVALLQAALAVLFIVQSPLATGLWPIPNTTPLTFIFFGSIALAAAASTLFCVLLNVPGALVGIALDYIVIFAVLAVYMLRATPTLGSGATTLVFGGVGGVLFGLWLLWYGWRRPITDARRTPLLVRISFILFVIALILVGGVLVTNRPYIMPWSITGNGAIIGWMFLGAAVYFAYGVVRPRWHNAGGQLAGFLAYDLVLIIPFLQRLPTISDPLRASLIIYTIVVVYSGILAAYFLFVHPSTRIWSELRDGLRKW